MSDAPGCGRVTERMGTHLLALQSARRRMATRPWSPLRCATTASIAATSAAHWMQLSRDSAARLGDSGCQCVRLERAESARERRICVRPRRVRRVARGAVAGGWSAASGEECRRVCHDSHGDMTVTVTLATARATLPHRLPAPAPLPHLRSLPVSLRYSDGILSTSDEPANAALVASQRHCTDQAALTPPSRTSIAPVDVTT